MQDWLNHKDFKDELANLTEAELKDAFYKELSFGTAGLRGVVGAGTNRMNTIILRKTNYGYAKFLLNKFNNPTVVIAYDSRNKSLEFAKDSALMLAHLGIKVYLFSQITPTPVLSFAVRNLQASGGIVITASHNPPQYNGYKIYDEDGCQFVPELVEALTKEIAQAPNMFTYKLEDFEYFLNNKMITFIDEEVYLPYVKSVKEIQVYPELQKIISVVYSPLHGTGAYLGPRLLTELGYTNYAVTEQMTPDALFSTVKSPNPEDPKAFDLGLNYARIHKSDVIIATDPDADRLGVAVLDKGEYKFLTGNQVGAILIYYLCNNRLYDGVLFNTIVTSDIGAKIASSYGVKVVSTLTGFKYIGQQAKKIEGKEKFFFGYEESYGYVVSDFVRDKDALQALVLVCEVVNFYKHKNLTLMDVLNEIYDKFGYCEDDIVNLNFIGEQGTIEMNNILNYFRNNKISTLDVVTKEDYLNSVRYGDGESEISLPQADVLKYYLSDGSWFVLRPSGTEPKMKIYLCCYGNNKAAANARKEKIKHEILDFIERVKA